LLHTKSRETPMLIGVVFGSSRHKKKLYFGETTPWDSFRPHKIESPGRLFCQNAKTTSFKPQ